jgi:hypothetical protein
MMRLACCAGVLGSQVSNSLFDKLKHAGAKLLPENWPGHNSQSPADSNTSEERDLGLEHMAASSKHTILS